MLLLTRKTDERIKIITPDGTVINVMVCKVKSDGGVRIGIDAPKNVEIHREEVWHAIQRKAAAAGETC